MDGFWQLVLVLLKVFGLGGSLVGKGIGIIGSLRVIWDQDRKCLDYCVC